MAKDGLGWVTQLCLKTAWFRKNVEAMSGVCPFLTIIDFMFRTGVATMVSSHAIYDVRRSALMFNALYLIDYVPLALMLAGGSILSFILAAFWFSRR